MMAVRTPRRLPGLRFETQSLPSIDVLPRMDVAVFVGFAASGPLHTPVVVEDIAQFTAIFGADLSLAWDQQRGETIYAYLAPAVRAFFRNGGRRCWVIRVAGRAQYNTFRIPGLKQVFLDSSGSVHEIRDAVASARSEGSWSDSLHVAATLLSQTYAVEQCSMGDQQVLLTVAISDLASAIVVGDLLRLTFRERKDYMLMVVVQSVQGLAQGTGSAQGTIPTMVLQSVQGSTPIPTRHVRITGKTPIWLLLSSSLPSEASHIGPPAPEIVAELSSDTVNCERLTFELWVKQDESYPLRLSNLGFEAGHPSYWNALPTDQQLYQHTATTSAIPTTQPATAAYADLWKAASDPRLPLAGAAAANSFFIPIGMALLPNQFSGAEPFSGTALERDGLSTFGADLFLDPDLRESFTNDLLTRADFIRYHSSAPRPLLRGIHAALEIEEATLIAVPDALHRGWKTLPEPEVLAPLPSALPPHPEWWHFLDCDPPPTIPSVHEPQWGHFLDCGLRLIGVPTLSSEQDRPGASTFTLFWTLPETDAQSTRYVLEEATSPDFSGSLVIDYYTPAESSVVIYGRSAGNYYYRMRAEVKGVLGDWSDGIVVHVGAESQWQLNTVEEYAEDTLVVVQRALLRMCGARSDILAILTMPEHYREDAAIRHATTLTSALSFGEANALSYGAIYHPWLNGREEERNANGLAGVSLPVAIGANGVRSVPPDGAICGVIAQRAIARGAWIAPANETLRNVVALTPAIARVHWLRLQEAQINLIRQEPRGFLTLSADTLSNDPDLLPINVRRLLILLRRLALRLGVTYVFEPNSDALRRLVQRNFEAMLGQMFARGAFAGDTPQTAFQVITDNTLNTAQSIEAGRLIVELRVAPSLPMTFLTLRLVQTGERGIVTEGG